MNEYRVIMSTISGVCVLACAAGVWIVVDVVMTVVVSVLIGSALVALAVTAARRELRIRRRLAAIQPRPAAEREAAR